MPVETVPAIGNPAMPIPPTTTSESTALFAQNALLAGIDPEVFGKISTRIEALTFAPDQIVFAENDPGDSLYLIGEGSIKISKRGRAGQQETLAYLPAGDYF